MTHPTTHPDALARALVSLEGLSVGDGFGEQFFANPGLVVRRTLPPAPWRWTDDTEMAVSIVEVLAVCGEIDQDRLAASFARRYTPGRGYGAGAHDLMEQLVSTPWREASRALFGGTGSYGNGGAMRVPPLGAFFADRPLSVVVKQARLAAEITHAHLEGQAGAVAVAVAAATLFRSPDVTAEGLFDVVRAHTPQSETREGIKRAARMETIDAAKAARVLGAGQRISAQDTVPFCIYAMAYFHDDFEEAMWQTVAGFGDRDTTCAIVGGAIAGASAVPRRLLEAREPLPEMTLG